jgi:hypothetical protein
MVSKTKRAKEPLESEIQAECMERFRKLGIYPHRRNVATMFAVHNGKTRAIKAGEKGQSDLWAIAPIWTPNSKSEYPEHHRHIECEVKRGKNKPTLDQTLWLRETGKITGCSFWTNNPDICELLLRDLLHGARIAYLDTIWTYDTEHGKIDAPGADFELIIHP